MHIITIPNWRPMSDNVYCKGHWSIRYRKKKEDAEFVSAYATQSNIPKAETKRRVSVEVIVSKGRTPDPTNILKSLMDALVSCKLLVDDNAEWSELGGVLVKKGADARTIIILEDLC